MVFESYDNDSHVNIFLFASHPDAQLVVPWDMNSSLLDESKVCGLPLSPDFIILQTASGFADSY